MNTFIAALIFSAAQSSYLGDYTLPLREGTAEIHGRVLDALSKKPVADLEVLSSKSTREAFAVWDRVRDSPSRTPTLPAGSRSAKSAPAHTEYV